MKVASSILSWIGGVLTLSALWVYYLFFNVLSAYYDLLSVLHLTLNVFLIFNICYSIFVLIILILRQALMNTKGRIPLGILTLIFVSLLGGIFTLCIRVEKKDKKRKKEQEVAYEIGDDGRRYKRARPLPEKIISCKRTLIDSALIHEHSKDTKLVAVEVKDGISRLETSAFSNYINMVTISLPNTLRYIDSNCFFNCKKLKFIIFNGTQLEWARIKRGSNWLLRVPTTSVYCSDGPITVNPVGGNTYKK